MQKICTLALLSLLHLMPVESCTDFLLQAVDKTWVNGRSLEFGQPLDVKIVSTARGQTFQSTAPNQQKGLKWTSKYGYVALSAFGGTTPLDGLNEKGLSIGLLWMPSSQYQEVPTGQEARSLAVTEIVDWILASFATVDEVSKALQDLYVWGPYIAQMESVPPVHLTIHDTLGYSIVVEFMDQKQQIYNNTVGILTNFPTYDWHIQNLRNYLNLSQMNDPPTMIDGLSLTNYGQGGGLLGMPGDLMPPSRFVKAAFYKHFCVQSKTRQECINLAEHILNSVDIPMGVIKTSGSTYLETTQWIVIKDMSNRVLYYRTYGNMTLRMIDLKKLDFSGKTKFQQIGLENPVEPIDMTSKLKADANPGTYTKPS